MSPQARHEAARTVIASGGVVQHLQRFQKSVRGGVVTFRFDDGPITDLAFCLLMSRCGIPVEIAIPAAYVGQKHRLTVAHLKRLTRAGHTVANHSWSHGPAPRTVDDVVREITAADRWFDDHGIATWSFVQPGPWSGDGAGSLDDSGRVAALNRRIGDRFVCLEGYAAQPLLPLPLDGNTRLGLSHVTIDDLSWRAIAGIVRRVATECLFAEFVVHTAKCVKTIRGALLAGRLYRLARLCRAYERKGLLRCQSVLGGVFAGRTRGESLIDEAPSDVAPDGSLVWTPKEPLLPGVSYAIECAFRVGVSYRGVRDASLCEASRGVHIPLRLRRSVTGLTARFGIDAPGRWELHLRAGTAAPASVALYVG